MQFMRSVSPIRIIEVNVHDFSSSNGFLFVHLWAMVVMLSSVDWDRYRTLLFRQTALFMQTKEIIVV